jgi:hypothetical protein
MISRRNKFRKNTLRRRKVNRRGHSRRQRGGGAINIYAQLVGTKLSNLSCDRPLGTNLSSDFSKINVTFNTPIRFAGATWSKSVNNNWIPVGTYLTTNPNSSYIFQATPTGTVGLKTIKKAGTPIAPRGTNMLMPPSGGISTSIIAINNITENTSTFAAIPRVSTMASPIDKAPVNIRITLNTIP